MKTLKCKIVPLLSLLIFFACGEIEYVQPVGGSHNGEDPGGDDITGPTGQEFTYHANDLPVFYFDVVLQDNGRMNAAGAPVPLLTDLRAAQEVFPAYPFSDDTLLTRQSGVFNQSYLSEMGIPEANMQDVFLDLFAAELTEVKIRAVGLNAQNEVDLNINGEVQKFYIQMKWGNGFSSSLEAGNLSGGDLNYVLKDTYTAQINSSNPNNRRLVEIFILAIDFFWQRQEVYFLAEGWTTLDYGTKLRYYFTITGDIKFSMHLREN